jgi:hypothetical protein
MISKGKKVKLSLCLSNQALRHEDVWRSEGMDPLFLTSSLDGDEWSASRPDHFRSGEVVPVTLFIGGFMGPSAGLDATEKRKIFYLCRGSKSYRSAL